jgi:hypothetical protein
VIAEFETTRPGPRRYRELTIWTIVAEVTAKLRSSYVDVA